MKFLKILPVAIAALIFQLVATAGHPEEDAVVNTIKNYFDSAQLPMMSDLLPGTPWLCNDYSAESDDFSKEENRVLYLFEEEFPQIITNRQFMKASWSRKVAQNFGYSKSKNEIDELSGRVRLVDDKRKSVWTTSNVIRVIRQTPQSELRLIIEVATQTPASYSRTVESVFAPEFRVIAYRICTPLPKRGNYRWAGSIPEPDGIYSEKWEMVSGSQLKEWESEFIGPLPQYGWW